MKSHAKGEVLTGVFYINAKAPSFIDMLNVTDQPLATLPESMTRPGKEVLDAVDGRTSLATIALKKKRPSREREGFPF